MRLLPPTPLFPPFPPPHQVDNLSYFMPVSAGESVLSLLPPWHIYERSASYVLSRGAKQVRVGGQGKDCAWMAVLLLGQEKHQGIDLDHFVQI